MLTLIKSSLLCNAPCKENFIGGEPKGEGQVTNLKKEVYNFFFFLALENDFHLKSKRIRRKRQINHCGQRVLAYAKKQVGEEEKASPIPKLNNLINKLKLIAINKTLHIMSRECIH